MCASGGNAQCDSMLDRKVITKVLNNLTETVKEISPKVVRVQTLAKDMVASMEKVHDCVNTLKSDLSEEFQILEELFDEVKRPLYPDLYREAAVKCDVFIHDNYEHLLYIAGIRGADMIPTNAAILRKVMEVLEAFIELTNKGLDKAVGLIETAKENTEVCLKDQKGMREDVRKRFADLKELVKAETRIKDT